MHFSASVQRYIRQGLSQEELAMAVEVTRQTIGLIESSKFNPSLSLCLQIARIYFLMWLLMSIYEKATSSRLKKAIEKD